MRIEIQEATVEKKSYMGDSSLSELVLNKQLTQIGEWAFSKCKNLRTVTFEGSYTPNLIARGVFEDCKRLETVSFADFGEDESHLLAASISKLKNQHLLRSDDFGEKSWFEKWDLALKIFLSSDDEKMTAANALCGEEDISYDGIGMVDGEMPGESSDFVKEAAMNKCLLCYLRLSYSKDLSDEMRCFINDYINNHSFGCEDDFAWVTLKEICGDNMDYFRLYLDVVKPKRDTINGMIDDLGDNLVLARSFLINECSDNSLSAIEEMLRI